TISGPLPAWAAIGKLSVIFSGASIVTLRPRSVLNFSTIGARARPRSLSIQTKSSPLVHANSFGVTRQRANNINNKRFMGAHGQTFTVLELPDTAGAKKSRIQEFEKSRLADNGRRISVSAFGVFAKRDVSILFWDKTGSQEGLKEAKAGGFAYGKFVSQISLKSRSISLSGSRAPMACSINPSSKRYRRDASFSTSLRIVSLQERPTAVSLSSRGMICTIPPIGVLMANTFFMWRLTCLLFLDRMA